MKKFLKLLLVALGSFLLGGGCALLLAKSASERWVTLSYTFLADELRLDAGEAAGAARWDEVDRDLTAILKIKGREGGEWFWYFPLVSWVGADYTMGPSGPHRVEDVSIAAYAATKNGDVPRATALYAELEKMHPGASREAWEKFAANKLKVFESEANGTRRGVLPPGVILDKNAVPSATGSAGR